MFAYRFGSCTSQFQVYDIIRSFLTTSFRDRHDFFMFIWTFVMPLNGSSVALSRRVSFFSNTHYPDMGSLGEESQAWNIAFSFLCSHLRLRMHSHAARDDQMWASCSQSYKSHADILCSNICPQYNLHKWLFGKVPTAHLPHHLVIVNGLSVWYVFRT